MKNITKLLFRFLMVLSAVVLVLIAAFYIWLSTLEKWAPPTKPNNVPTNAVWAGGTDGGCFFLLQSEYSDTSRFIIYNEYTGNIWYDGYFYCSKSDFNRISKKDWRELVACYNGKYIFMKDPDDKKREIVWRKVMPESIPDPDEVNWVEGENGGWFIDLPFIYEDTSRFIIYDDITGEVLYDGYFYCDKKDFEHIQDKAWSCSIKGYDGENIIMTYPEDGNKLIKWYPIK